MSKKKIILDDDTRQRQTTASDPKNTVWVSANAGSGKTHVLSQRVIRLLLEGVEPSKILCLTYTKTAAAEMINRVFERLADWVALDDEALSAAIFDIEERSPDAKRLQAARTLFAKALEAPGGLQIQTIHAFCTTILKRFPLEANIVGHFELLDDDTSALFHQEAKRRVTSEAWQGGDEALSHALETVLDVAQESGLAALFSAALSGPERSALQNFLKLVDTGTLAPDWLNDFVGLSADETEDAILQTAWPLASLPLTRMQQIIAKAGSVSGSSIPAFAETLQELMKATDPAQRFEILAKLFLKDNGEPRSPRNLLKISHDFGDVFMSAANEVLTLTDRLAKRAMADVSQAALTLIARLTSVHTAMKRDGGFLDYEDLIEATYRLLNRDYAAAWVQYKLDQGIDHVLVDEAQDTSPRQWAIVNTLTADFFAGETSARTNRTLFVVGDEKQSIYSFQGAKPEVFAQTGREKGAQLRQIERRFEDVRFSLSFRSTPEILRAVDHVFANPTTAEGVASQGNDIIHQTIRQKQHGHVEVWETIAATKTEEEDDWTKPVDHATAPAVMLANDVAKTIKKLVGQHKNPATGKIVQAGDILVLVRKRDKFMHALSKELKDLNVPVAGADRLVLTSHIAVLDLLAAARVTLQPGDDLSLAALLRSPIFGMSEAALTDLASERQGRVSLMDRLAARAVTDADLAAILETLNRWRTEADFVPVYEFFAKILSADGGRARFIARLGEEASDIIDEFLSYALVSERSGLLGLQAFVETLSRSAPEIKREASSVRNEVRIMTVHGAKGLEAPYVFLVDPGSAPVSGHHKASLFAVPITVGNHAESAFVWVPNKKFDNSSVAKQRADMAATQLAEYKRLLYVGMTRAEDVLIVCSYRGTKTSKEPTWSDMVRAGLEGKEGVKEHQHPVTQKPVLYFKLGGSEFEPQEVASHAELSVEAMPDWLNEKLPPFKLPPRPLTPSGKGVTIDAQAESGKKSPVLDFVSSAQNPALARGAAVHKLLEVLPNLPQSERNAAAKRYLQATLPHDASDHLLNKIMQILDDQKFASLFTEGSRAEVSIGGNLELDGETRSISGKIDRLAVSDTRVLIADYKTNRPAPATLDEVPTTHIAQLALYRAVLLPLYPEKIIEAALIYTEGPHLISVDAMHLDAALEALSDS